MLIFAGIGPGDKELITYKAVRAIREADAVAVVDTGMGRSMVEEIAGEWFKDKPVLRIPVPMHGMRDSWKEAHQQAAKTLIEALKQYPIIVYPVLGDPSVYATSSYLKRIVEKDHPCSVIPGIPTMCAMAARLGEPLCEQGEVLTVTDKGGDLPEGTVVCMKAEKRVDAILENLGDRKAWLVQELGLPNEVICELTPETEIKRTYFTTIVVK